MGAIVALLSIARIGRSVAIAAMLFIVLLARTHSVSFAITYSVPVGLIAMLGYVINDLHDVERDRLNHPERPLPSEAITLSMAAFFFFFILAAMLVMVRLTVPIELAFGYAIAALAIINYNYVVAYLWPLKNIYVSAIATLPLLVIWKAATPPIALVPVAVTVFLYSLGAEVLSDIKDSSGDGSTPAKWLGEPIATVLAFSCKLSGGMILLVVSKNPWMASVALALITIDVAFLVAWRTRLNRSVIIRAMLVQILLGTAYLA